MNIELARFNMIEQQIRTWDVLNQDVLNLLEVVKREDFVPTAYKSLAFFDTEIPLPCGENMLMPKMEARILQEVAVQKHENVLEIGTGSGYMAALLCHKARHVTSIEIEPELKAMADRNLSGYGITNVTTYLGDGARGWAGTSSAEGDNGSYDVIVISGSLPVLPDAFLKKLKLGGRIFAIIGDAPAMSGQIISRMSDTAYSTVNLFETNVKPLRNAIRPSHFSF
ncbi:MAG: protein-L-isoaspartate O-methyltransferase [Burkholderiaceae bacterium]